MYIEEVSPSTYKKTATPAIFFNSVAFNELNRPKADDVRYFLFRDTKYRFGLCGGMQDCNLKAPFSAPFSSLSPVHSRWSVQQLTEALQCLDALAVEENWNSIRLTLPPAIYAPDLITATQCALLQQGYSVCFQDLNYALNLEKLYCKNYPDLLPPNGRKNIRIALNSQLDLFHCGQEKEKKRAYDVIARNRKAKGYPLRMSWEDVRKTIQLVPHDFFLVRNNDAEIAAAQIFHVTEDIAQVIYWGDIPGHAEYKPINYLAYMLIQHYGEKKFRYLDVGPSSERGIPNYGLCDFKNSIGCQLNAKFTFEKKYRLKGSYK